MNPDIGRLLMVLAAALLHDYHRTSKYPDTTALEQVASFVISLYAVALFAFGLVPHPVAFQILSDFGVSNFKLVL